MTSNMVRFVNLGCGLYALVISWNFFKFWPGVDIPPDPIHPVHPNVLQWLLSPYALVAVGLVLVGVNALGAMQKRTAAPA